MIFAGPTGVGKTEIARRLAKLVAAPFVKVEATKFTEVGYVGRDVDSIVRDLVENAIRMVKEEHIKRVEPRAKVIAEDRLVTLLVHPPKKPANGGGLSLDYLLGRKPAVQEECTDTPEIASKREDVRQQLMRGELEEHEHTLECYSDPDADLEGPSYWESTLPGSFTGNYAEDLLAVARSQLGYTESTLNFQLDENGLNPKLYLLITLQTCSLWKKTRSLVSLQARFRFVTMHLINT